MLQEAILKRKKAANKIVSGAIVGIIKKNWRPYCGVLQPPTIKGVSIIVLKLRIIKLKISNIFLLILSLPVFNAYTKNMFV